MPNKKRGPKLKAKKDKKYPMTFKFIYFIKQYIKKQNNQAKYLENLVKEDIEKSKK